MRRAPLLPELTVATFQELPLTRIEGQFESAFIGRPRCCHIPATALDFRERRVKGRVAAELSA